MFFPTRRVATSFIKRKRANCCETAGWGTRSLRSISTTVFSPSISRQRIIKRGLCDMALRKSLALCASATKRSKSSRCGADSECRSGEFATVIRSKPIQCPGPATPEKYGSCRSGHKKHDQVLFQRNKTKRRSSFIRRTPGIPKVAPFRVGRGSTRAATAQQSVLTTRAANPLSPALRRTTTGRVGIPHCDAPGNRIARADRNPPCGVRRWRQVRGGRAAWPGLPWPAARAVSTCRNQPKISETIPLYQSSDSL